MDQCHVLSASSFLQSFQAQFFTLLLVGRALQSRDLLDGFFLDFASSPPELLPTTRGKVFMRGEWEILQNIIREGEGGIFQSILQAVL